MATTVDNPTTPPMPVLVLDGPLPIYRNDADARAKGAKDNTLYMTEGSGLVTQLRAAS